MATREDIGKALKAADAAGDVEGATKLANAYASAQQSQSMDWGAEGVNALHQFTRGVYGNIPVVGPKIVDAASRGYVGNPNSILGRAAYVSGAVVGSIPTMAAGGVMLARNAATRLGDATATAIGPQMGRAENLTRQFFSDVADSLMTSATKTLSTAAGIGAVSGAAGGAVAEAGGTPTEQSAAEMAAGLGSAPVTAMAKLYSTKLSLTSMAARGANFARKIVQSVRNGPPIPAVAPPSALERLNTLVVDPVKAVANLAKPDLLPDAAAVMSPAARSGDTGLLSLEKALMRDVPGLDLAHQQAHQEVLGTIKKAGASLETGDATVSDARSYLSSLLDKNIEMAGQKLSSAVSGMRPGASPEDMSVLTTKLLESAKSGARDQERQLYDAVDNTAAASADGTISLWGKFLSEQNISAKVLDNLPSGVTRLLGHVGQPLPPQPVMVAGKPIKMAVTPSDTPQQFYAGQLSKGATIGDLVRLRSDLLRTVREQEGSIAPDNRLIGISNMLAESILGDLSKIEGNDALKLARGFSADLNERFTKGTVGQILGSRSTGGARIPPQLSLYETVGKADMPGAVATGDILKALERTGDLPKGREYIASYITDRFLRSAQLPNGDLNNEAASSFIKQNMSTLKHFPELQRQFENAIALKDSHALAVQLGDPQKSLAAIILKKDPGAEINAIMGSQRASEATRLTMAQLPPEAQSGLRSSFFDWVMDQDGAQLMKRLSDPKTIAVMNELQISHEQRTSLNTILNTYIANQKWQSAKPALGGIMGHQESLTGSLHSFAERVVGAKIAGLLNKALPSELRVGSLQVASEGATLGSKVAGIVADPARVWLQAALKDPELLKAGLIQTNANASKSAKAAADRKLKSWLAAQPGVALASQQDQPQ